MSATTYGRQQADIIAAVAEALSRSGAPSMDRGLKNIVSSHIRDLLAGHYPLDLIRQQALNLAATSPGKLYDLAKNVRAEQEARDENEHKRRMLAEKRDLERGMPDLDIAEVVTEFERAGIEVPAIYRRALEKRGRIAAAVKANTVDSHRLPAVHPGEKKDGGPNLYNTDGAPREGS